mmetsp:Transcript_65054/g.146202  ORF Transcript_65054/g.146202 Transcript_65054/m.146202 type:complete len:114 (-) Transcript_65054:174-515(-)
MTNPAGARAARHMLVLCGHPSCVPKPVSVPPKCFEVKKLWSFSVGALLVEHRAMDVTGPAGGVLRGKPPTVIPLVHEDRRSEDCSIEPALEGVQLSGKVHSIVRLAGNSGRGG